MRKTVRVYSTIQPVDRLARAIATLPPGARGALRVVARRDDLPLVAGSWNEGDGGCLVANVLRAFGATSPAPSRLDPARPATLDLQILELLPELSSRDLNELIVAWDEAALQVSSAGDRALRPLLRAALDQADAAGAAKKVGPPTGTSPFPLPLEERTGAHRGPLTRRNIGPHEEGRQSHRPQTSPHPVDSPPVTSENAQRLGDSEVDGRWPQENRCPTAVH